MLTIPSDHAEKLQNGTRNFFLTFQFDVPLYLWNKLRQKPLSHLYYLSTKKPLNVKNKHGMDQIDKPRKEI